MRGRAAATRFSSIGKTPARRIFGLDVRSLQKRGELGEMSAFHITMRPRSRHPAAIHDRSDELIIVLRGGGRLRVGRQVRRLAPGVTVYIPAGKVHEVWSGADGMQVLSLFTPGMDPARPDIRLVEAA